MSVAVITGASAGLGKAYVETIIWEYPEIDELWLIARRKDRLESIASDYPDKRFEIISCDLADTSEYSRLRAIFDEKKPDIKFLVNDAGMFVRGDFADVPLERQITQVNLNSMAMIAVTHICLPYMQRGGAILEVGSTSSFGVEPHITVYCASKAFVRFFGHGLRYELKSKGINVCTVNPGYMETDMNADLRAASSIPRNDIHELAYKSMRAALNGRADYTLGGFYNAMAFVSKVLPITAFAWVMDKGHDLSYKLDEMRTSSLSASTSAE